MPESFHLDGEFPTVDVPGQVTKNGDPADQPIPKYLLPDLKSWLTGKELGRFLFPQLEHLKTSKMIKHDLELGAGLPYKVGRNGYRDFHSLRHFYITNAHTSGEESLVIKQQARHADLKTTEGYSHVPDRKRHETANKMKPLPLLEGLEPSV